MTYRLTALVPDADPVIDVGEAPSLNPSVAMKLITATFIAAHPALRWTTLTIELTRTV